MAKIPTQADILQIFSSADGRITAKSLASKLKSNWKLDIPQKSDLTKKVHALKELLERGRLIRKVGNGKKRKWVFFELPHHETQSRKGRTGSTKTSKKPTTPVSFWEELPLLVRAMHETLELIQIKGLEIKRISDGANSALQNLGDFRTRVEKEVGSLREQVEKINARLEKAGRDTQESSQMRNGLKTLTDRAQKLPANTGRPTGFIAEDQSTVNMSGPVCQKCWIQMSANDDRVEHDGHFHQACFEQTYLADNGVRPNLEPVSGKTHVFKLRGSPQIVTTN